jgi:hypothetical protein
LSGQEETSFGKYFAPLLNIRIENHVLEISYKIRPLEIGVDIIIPVGWLIVEDSISFEGNEIQEKQHIGNDELIISYDETVLYDKEMVWIGSLTTTKVPDFDELNDLVPKKCYIFMNLFGEPLAQEPPPCGTFAYQIQITEGKEVPFGPIYHLSE